MVISGAVRSRTDRVRDAGHGWIPAEGIQRIVRENYGSFREPEGVGVTVIHPILFPPGSGWG
ncbi:MAG: hypothetical protein MUF54_13095 [Polyangiaceae bacterium]|jgi:hypothetical protein|nr:hypothetical protein [Polyangiaceae bacterium]